MISRRDILKWLGLAPVAIAVASVPHASEYPYQISTGVRPRTRAWKTVLEPDGSSSFVKDGERWLDSWVKTQKEEDWGRAHGSDGTRVYKSSRLQEIEQIIKDDAESMKERVDHWRDFQAFQRENGVEVEAIFTEPGEMLANDPVIPEAKYVSLPTFQFHERDWPSHPKGYPVV